MNKRGEHKIPFLHEVIRKQDVRTCCRNLKRNTCTDVQAGWVLVYYRGFHAGRDLKWKKFSLSVSIGLHEKWICSMNWIQGRLYVLILQQPEAWVGPLVLIARCLYLEARVCPQNTEQRNGRCFWASYDWESMLCLLEVGRTEFSLAKVFEPLSHTAPSKPTDVLLASCTGMWVRSHVFGSLFLYFTPRGFLDDSFWVNHQLADSILNRLL